MKQLKFVLPITFLFLCSTAYSASKGTNPNGKPFIELSGQIIEVEGEVSSLQDQIDSLVAQVDSLDARVTADEAAILSLQEKNNILQQTLDSYGQTTGALQEQINTLVIENADLKLLVESGDTQLQTQIDDNNALITSLQMAVNDIGDLQSQISNNTDLIALLTSEIEQISEGLALKQTIISGNCPGGFAVQAINPDGSVVCTTSGGTGDSTIPGLKSAWVINYHDVPAYGVHTTQDFCPAGYLASGAGLWYTWKQDVDGHYAVSNYGFYRVRNKERFPSLYATVTTCLKVE